MNTKSEESERADFILTVTNNCMRDPQNSKEEKDDGYNPLSILNNNTLSKIYTGNRSLSKKKASVYVDRFSHEKFSAYLHTFSEPQLETIKRSLKEAGMECPENCNFIEHCTGIFWDILLEAACRQHKTKVRRTQLHISIENDLSKSALDPIKAESSNITTSSADISGAQLTIPDECKQKCMFCRNWVCDMKYAPDDISEADGQCKRARGKDTKGSDGCEKFDPNLSAISEYLLYGIYPFSPSRLLCKTFSSIKR
jgi:hypothetical protein